MRAIWLSLALAFCGGILPLSAQAVVAKYDLNIPRLSLDAALKEFAQQTGLQVARFSDTMDGGGIVGPIEGNFSAQEALESLLAPSGLTYHVVNERTIAVVKPPTDSSRIQSVQPQASSGIDLRDSDAAKKPGFWNRIRLAQNESSSQAEPVSGESQSTESPRRDDSLRDSVDIGEIVVTGTRIKNVSDQFSPVTRVNRDSMDRAGALTVADVFDKLPQNFGGGVGPDTTPAGASTGAGSAGINLWGLGNEATLVLLNGRRLAPGGLLGNFVDVSAIPTSAIDRIEVLPDGASAIYGSDAIAGVVNIVMRDNFSGAETRLGASGVDGGAESVVFGQTLGWSGERTHGLLTYQYLDQNELNQNDKSFSRGQLPDPHWLLPASEIHSVFASGGVEVTPRVSLDIDAYYNRRDSEGTTSAETFAVFNNFQTVDVEQYGAGGGLHADVGNDWTGQVSLTYSASSSLTVSTNGLRDITDDADSDVTSIDASVGGPLFHVAQEPVELVFGAYARRESQEYLTASTDGFSDELDEDRRVFSGYFELLVPLVGPADGMPGAHRLVLTAAARYDDYDDVGSSFDPRVGVTWSPIEGFSLRGTWGTAFRAPSLWQLRDVYFADLGLYADPDVPDGESVALVVQGQRTDLSPEEADVWTAGFDFAPAWLEGFRLRATYFDIGYDGRVAFPQLGINSDFQFTGDTGTVIRGLTTAEIQALADNAQIFTNLSDFLPIDPLTLADTEIILDVRARNMSRSVVRGVEVDISYGIGDWSWSLTGAYLTDFTQQAAPTTPVEDLLNTFANPVDLRLRGGVSWGARRTTASLFVNHVAGYTDNQSTDPAFHIDDWTTVDASLRFDFGPMDRATSLTLTIENLLDEDPPPIGPHVFQTSIFDAANSDPSGRCIGLLVSKRW